MTRSFSRFLHSLSDEDLVAFVRRGAERRPPYWRALQLALRIEQGRRELVRADFVAAGYIPDEADQPPDFSRRSM